MHYFDRNKIACVHVSVVQAMTEYFRQPIVDTFDINICTAKTQRHIIDFQVPGWPAVNYMTVPCVPDGPRDGPAQDRDSARVPHAAGGDQVFCPALSSGQKIEMCNLSLFCTVTLLCCSVGHGARTSLLVRRSVHRVEHDGVAEHGPDPAAHPLVPGPLPPLPAHLRQAGPAPHWPRPHGGQC